MRDSFYTMLSPFGLTLDPVPCLLSSSGRGEDGAKKSLGLSSCLLLLLLLCFPLSLSLILCLFRPSCWLHVFVSPSFIGPAA